MKGPHRLKHNSNRLGLCCAAVTLLLSNTQAVQLDQLSRHQSHAVDLPETEDDGPDEVSQTQVLFNADDADMYDAADSDNEDDTLDQ